MVDAGPFHTGALALGRGVIEGEQPAGAGVERTAEATEEQGRVAIDPAAADRAEQVVAAAEVVGAVAGPEPGGGGPAAVGEEDALEEGLEEVGLAGIDQGG